MAFDVDPHGSSAYLTGAVLCFRTQQEPSLESTLIRNSRHLPSFESSHFRERGVIADGLQPQTHYKWALNIDLPPKLVSLVSRVRLLPQHTPSAICRSMSCGA